MTTNLNTKAVSHKIEYYRLWYKDLTKEEKASWLGVWILERITFFVEAFNTEIREMKQVA
jgi:hypothetical protein